MNLHDTAAQELGNFMTSAAQSPMRVGSTFWAQTRRVFARFIENDAGAMRRVNSFFELLSGSHHHLHHQAASELFTVLGGLPNARDLAFLIARMVPVTSHGDISIGVRVAPTLSHTLRLVADFHHLAVPLVDYSYQETKTEGLFTIGFRCAIDGKGEAFATAVAIGMLDREVALVTGRSGNLRSVDLTPSSRGYEPVYRKYLSVNPDMGQRSNGVVIDRAILDLPNPLADVDTFDNVVSTCMERVNVTVSGRTRSAQVRELVMSSISNPPSLEALSNALHQSPRQLRILLARENTSYQAIVRSCRIEYASTLFRNPALTVSQIAYRLGYSDLSAFTHSFCRWTGKSPSVFRIEMLSKPASF